MRGFYFEGALKCCHFLCVFGRIDRIFLHWGGYVCVCVTLIYLTLPLKEPHPFIVATDTMLDAMFICGCYLKNKYMEKYIY